MVNAEFAHFVNEYDKVMTENFAECFVDHGVIVQEKRRT